MFVGWDSTTENNRISGKKSLSLSHAQKSPLVSFLPQQQRTSFGDIKPGIYIFVQDAATKQVFLWNTNSGQGHPFLADRVNKEFNRPLGDYSWLEAAGELVYGHEILGFSFRTGFFHQALGLTESPEASNCTPNIQQKLAASSLPVDRYFSVQAWETLAFSRTHRSFFFSEAGFLKSVDLNQLEQFRREIQEPKLDTPYPENILTLFNRLIRTIEQLPKENKRLTSFQATPSIAPQCLFYSTQALAPCSFLLQDSQGEASLSKFGLFSGQQDGPQECRSEEAVLEPSKKY